MEFLAPRDVYRMDIARRQAVANTKSIATPPVNTETFGNKEFECASTQSLIAVIRRVSRSVRNTHICYRRILYHCRIQLSAPDLERKSLFHLKTNTDKVGNWEE